MARLPRLFVPGCPQHVMQRGHNRMAVFLDDEDRQRYLAWLTEALRERQVALHAYALMGNHLHLLVSAARAEDTSRAMQSVGRRYAQHFNLRHGRSGTIWEGRYRSTVVADERYVMQCYRYIDMNPVRAGLVDHPSAWPWTSWAHHVGRRIDPFVTDHPLYWALGNTPFERQAAYERLCEQASSREAAAITEATLKGWALGEPGAGAGLGEASRRPVPARRGRPPKAKVPAGEQGGAEEAGVAGQAGAIAPGAGSAAGSATGSVTGPATGPTTGPTTRPAARPAAAGIVRGRDTAGGQRQDQRKPLNGRR